MLDVRKALALALLAGVAGLGAACDGSNPRTGDEYQSEEFGSAFRSAESQTVDVELKDGEIDMPKEIEAGTVILAIKNDDSEAHGLAIERTDAAGSQMPQSGTMREPQAGSESESMREPMDDPLAEPGSQPQPQREPERAPGTEPQHTPGTEPQHTPGTEPQRTPGTEPLPGTQPPRDLGQTPSDMQGDRRQSPDMSGSRALGSGENLLQNFRLQPGEEKEVFLTLLPGSYRVYCPESGHRQTDAEEIIVTVVGKDE